jgi:hypothetical protein
MRIAPEIPILINIWCLARFQNICVHFTVKTSQVPGNVVSLNFGTRVLHLIQLNCQTDATIFQFIILTFV